MDRAPGLLRLGALALLGQLSLYGDRAALAEDLHEWVREVARRHGDQKQRVYEMRGEWRAAWTWFRALVDAGVLLRAAMHVAALLCALLLGAALLRVLASRCVPARPPPSGRCESNAQQRTHSRLLWLSLLGGAAAGVRAYVSQLDTQIFIAITALQCALLDQYRSVAPLLAFALPHVGAALARQWTLYWQDRAVNLQTLAVPARAGSRLPPEEGWMLAKRRAEVRVGEVIYLWNGAVAPADCVLLASAQRDEAVVFADESGLSGESGLRRKRAWTHFPDALPVPDALLRPFREDPRRAEHVLFQDTPVHVRGRRDALRVPALVVAVGSDTFLSRGRAFGSGGGGGEGQGSSSVRRADAATSSIERETQRRTLGAVAVLLLVVLLDTLLCAYYAHADPAHPAARVDSLLNLFLILLLFQNMLVPMATKPALMFLCLWRRWRLRAIGVACNDWRALQRLPDVRALCTDKTGTLTCNAMELVAARCFREAHTFLHPAHFPPAELPLRHQYPFRWFEQLHDAATADEFPAERECARLAARNLLHLYAHCSGEPHSNARDAAEPEEAAFLRALCASVGALRDNRRQHMDEGEFRIEYARCPPAARQERTCRVRLDLGVQRDLLLKAALVLDYPRAEEPVDGDSERPGRVHLVGQCAEEFLLDAAHVGAEAAAHNAALIDAWKEELREARESVCAEARAANEGALRVWYHFALDLSRVADLHQRIETLKEAHACGQPLSFVITALTREAGGARVAAASALLDRYRPGLRAAIDALVDSGRPFHVVTGDSRAAAGELMQALQPETDAYALEGEELQSAHSVAHALRRLLQWHRDGAATAARRAVFADRRVLDVLLDAQQRPAERRLRVVCAVLAEVFRDPRVCGVWTRALPHQKPAAVWLLQRVCALPVLYVGDQTNDLQAMCAAHASLALRHAALTDAAPARTTTTNERVAQQAGFVSREWSAVRPLLLQHAPSMLQSMRQVLDLVFLKHAATAWALQSWALLTGFHSFLEPYGAWTMIVFNAAAFYEILATGALLPGRAAPTHPPWRAVLTHAGGAALGALSAWICCAALPAGASFSAHMFALHIAALFAVCFLTRLFSRAEVQKEEKEEEKGETEGERDAPWWLARRYRAAAALLLLAWLQCVVS